MLRFILLLMVIVGAYGLYNQISFDDAFHTTEFKEQAVSKMKNNGFINMVNTRREEDYNTTENATRKY